MSIIRQRKKNLILAWLLGVLTTCLVVIVMVMFSVYGLDQYFKFEFKEETDAMIYVDQVVAARPIELGSILDADDLMRIQVPENQAIDNSLSIEALIGKETHINIDQMLPITYPMVESQSFTTDEQRLYEFDYVRLPFALDTGDVVDIRIVFPNGQDYVVLAKKEVMQFERSAEEFHKGLLSLLVEEDEVLRMSSALVDAVLTETAELYMVKYLDPVSQVAAEISYPMNRSVLSVLEKNPNIIIMPNMSELTTNRFLLDSALKELLDEDDEWFSVFSSTDDEMDTDVDTDGNANANANGNTDGNTNENGNTDGNTNANTDINSDTSNATDDSEDIQGF